MIYGIYSIRDVKTSFLSPTVDYNDDSAIRNFYHACKNANSLFFTSPEDYSLYKIGEFDSEVGTVEAYKVPKHIVDAFRENRKEID